MTNSSDKILIKGLLFDADYIDVGGKAWVRLWIKMEDGSTVVVYDPNFEPYFYAIVDYNYDINAIRESIERIPGIKRAEIVKRKDYGRERDVIKITVDFPKNVPSLREHVKRVDGVLDVREADIPFAVRYIIDRGLHPMDGVECIVEPLGTKRLKYPEYVAHEVKYSPLEREYPLRILAFDIEVLNPEISVDPEKDEIIMISYATGPTENDTGVFVSDGNERKLIEEFLELVAKYDPDIILTYNGNEFDWPYLKKRAEKYGISIKIGRDGSNVLIRPSGLIREAKAPGRALIDLYIIVERDLPEVKVKTLKNIAQYLGVMKKSERTIVRPQDIAKYWEDPKLRNELISYAKDDALATYLVGQELLPLQFEIAKLIRQPISRAYSLSRGRQVDWYLVAEAYKMGEIAPNKAEVREESIYEGALVLEPQKGLFEDVVYLDFGAMYPTIMITYNISPDTYVPPYMDVSEDNVYVAPEVGHRFLKKPDGFYRHILRNLIQRRKEIKTKMKKYPKGSKEYKVLNIQQLALKTLANSFYGYTGWRGARWYKRECAEATTAWGRYFIRLVKEKAESYGIKVLYGDSVSGDSRVIVRLPNGSIRTIKIEELFFMGEPVKGCNACPGKEYRAPRGIETLTLDDDGRLIWKPIEHVMRHKVQKKMYRIWVDENTYVDVTEDHSIIGIIERDGARRLVEVKPTEIKSKVDGVLVLNDSMNDVNARKVISVEEIPYNGYVYDICVNGVHNFFANGILVHNTDSIFVINHPRLREFINEVNETLPLELEIETIFRRVLFTGVKKRYAGITESGEIYIRGLEVRRGDWCELAKEVQEKVIEIVLKEGNPTKAKNYVKEIIQKLISGKITEDLVEKLVIYKTITRGLDEYVAEQAHVRAVKEAIKYHGFKYKPGMKVGILIIQRGGGKLAEKAILYDFYDPKMHRIDVEYYINKQIIPAVMRILSVFNINESELKSGVKQKTLFDL